MASLTGKFIKDTYQSLLKMIDNDNVSSTAKEITDGEGNGTGVSIDTSGNLTATGTIQGSSVTNGNTSISDLQTNKENKSEKGQADGYAPLDSNSKVPTANLPDSVLGQLEYKGTWNADTNTPTLPSASTVKGNYYVVSVAGVYETIDYEIGDWIVSNGTEWEKVDNSDKVSSVNGQTGVVVLDTDDIDEGETNQYYTSDRANTDFDTRLATKDTNDLTEGDNLYYTEARVSANSSVVANTAKVGITETQANAIIANTAKNSYPSEDAAKLLGIEAGANVTDVANVTTALNSISVKELSDVSETEPSNEQVLRYNSTSGEYEPTTLDLTGLVDSVNGYSGDVVLDTDDIDEGATNLYYTDARVSANTDVVANSAKNSYPSEDATKLSGIEAGAEVNTVDSVNSLTGAVSLGLLDLDDVGSDGTSGQVLTTNGLGSFSFTTVSGGGGDVDSVNGQTGTVVLDADDISDASTTNKFTTASDITKLSGIEAGAEVNPTSTDELSEGTTNLYYTDARVSANSAVAANTAKVGITTQQANDITTNNAKVSYPSADSTKVGFISVTQAVDLDTLESDVATNNAKVGITTQQANDITANNAKISFDSASSTKLAGIEAGAEVNPTSTDELSEGTTNLYYTDARVSANADVVANTAKVGITTQQAADIVTNNAKVGITAQQASDITANNAKISFDSASSTKLAGIEEGAEVNVNTDWDATSGDAQILNKPTLATVATSGSYNDLSDQPTIPTNNNQLTNGAGYITDGNTGWDNTYGFITASSTDTLTNKSGSNSQWTNDAGYTTNTGTVTSVSVGTGLDVTNGTTTPSITLDLSEFTDMTADLVGTDEFIVLDNGAERRKAANEISTSVLNTEIHTNAIGKAIDFSARVTLDGGVAEGTSAIIKNLQNVM